MQTLSVSRLTEKQLIKKLRAFRTLFRKQKIKDFAFEVDGKFFTYEFTASKFTRRKVMHTEETYSLKVHFTP